MVDAYVEYPGRFGTLGCSKDTPESFLNEKASQ